MRTERIEKEKKEVNNKWEKTTTKAYDTNHETHTHTHTLKEGIAYGMIGILLLHKGIRKI